MFLLLSYSVIGYIYPSPIYPPPSNSPLRQPSTNHLILSYLLFCFYCLNFAIFTQACLTLSIPTGIIFECHGSGGTSKGRSRVALLNHSAKLFSFLLMRIGMVSPPLRIAARARFMPRGIVIARFTQSCPISYSFQDSKGFLSYFGCYCNLVVAEYVY